MHRHFGCRYALVLCHVRRAVHSYPLCTCHYYYIIIIIYETLLGVDRPANQHKNN